MLDNVLTIEQAFEIMKVEFARLVTENAVLKSRETALSASPNKPHAEIAAEMVAKSAHQREIDFAYVSCQDVERWARQLSAVR